MQKLGIACAHMTKRPFTFRAINKLRVEAQKPPRQPASVTSDRFRHVAKRRSDVQPSRNVVKRREPPALAKSAPKMRHKNMGDH